MAQLFDPFYARFTYMASEEVLDFYLTFGAEDDNEIPTFTSEELKDAFETWVGVAMEELWVPFASSNVLLGYYIWTKKETALAPPWRRWIQRQGTSGTFPLPSDTALNYKLSGSLPNSERTVAVVKISGVGRAIVNGGIVDAAERTRFRDDAAGPMLAPINANGRVYRLAIEGTIAGGFYHCTRVDSIVLNSIAGSLKERIPNRPQRRKRPTV